MEKFGWVPGTREVKEKDDLALMARARIVVGRMQREGMIKYSMLNNLKDKYEITV